MGSERTLSVFRVTQSNPRSLAGVSGGPSLRSRQHGCRSFSSAGSRLRSLDCLEVPFLPQYVAHLQESELWGTYSSTNSSTTSTAPGSLCKSVKRRRRSSALIHRPKSLKVAERGFCGRLESTNVFFKAEAHLFLLGHSRQFYRWC